MLEYFSTHEEQKEGTTFPTNWIENISLLISETFEELNNKSITHQIWGELFSNELLVICSLMPTRTNIPITLIVSAPITQHKDNRHVKDILDRSIEMLGLLIEDFLNSNSDEYEFTNSWQEHKNKQTTLYFKTTRENIEATLEANKLLGN